MEVVSVDEMVQGPVKVLWKVRRFESGDRILEWRVEVEDEGKDARLATGMCRVVTTGLVDRLGWDGIGTSGDGVDRMHTPWNAGGKRVLGGLVMEDAVDRAAEFFERTREGLRDER